MALVGGIRHVLLIVNPASRTGGRALPRVVRAFADAGIGCTVASTAYRGHAEALARARPDGVDAIFTLGGDGTVMEVLHALLGATTVVGILPGGTGNLIARALGIPMSPVRAIARLLAGEVREIDLGQLEDGRVFAFAAGIGVDAQMVARAGHAAKRRFGVGAYVLEGTKAALALQAFTLRATVDGVPHTFRATTAMIANFGAVLGGLIRLGPGIREDDGMLDLCVFSPANVRDALRLGWRLLRHDFGTDPSMHFLRGRTMHLETEPPRETQADGELLPWSSLQVTVLPRAARLLVPATLGGRGA